MIIADVKSLISTGAVVAVILYLANLYRTRARVRVRVLAEQFYDPDKPPSLMLEMENVGLTATSAEPVIPFKGFLPRPRVKGERGKLKLERYELVFQLEGVQRTLEPHKPIRFEAKNEKVNRQLSAKLAFMFFKVYTFSFTRGSSRRARIYSVHTVPLSWFRYWLKRLDFKIRGLNSFPKPEEPAYLDD